MADIAFKVVDREILDKLQIKNRNRFSNNDNPMIEALMNGDVISVENVDKKKLQSLYQSARVRNKVMSLRSGTLNDVPTVVFWWEDAKAGN